MFESDYIMRLIKEMIRALFRLIFHTNAETPAEEAAADLSKEEKAALGELFRLADDGRIDEAENRLSDLVEEADGEALKIALLFYDHLNEKDDAFLEEHDFSRKEIKAGLETVAKKYGLLEMAEIFLEEE